MNKYNFELNLNDRNSLSILVNRVKKNSIILEFGPANGRMTKYMKEQLNCKIYAVEIDEKSAQDASIYTEKILVDSIENNNWQKEFKNMKFDYIIFADVLEHLYYPEKVLEDVKDFLKENGSILISIPNIAHSSIIINLLKNEFNYSPTGLLDDTHIRFFTKKTFDKLIERRGLHINYETAVFLKPQNTEFKNSYDELPSQIAEFIQKLSFGEVYQIIYEVKKKEVELISDFNEDYKINENFFIQLFIDEHDGYTEKNSIKFPILNNNETQKFHFELLNNQNIKNLRLDPLNDSCVIDIKKIYLILEDNTNIDLSLYLSTDVSSNYNNYYFFDFYDPQIYFNNLDLSILNIKNFVVELKYKYISNNARLVCSNQMLNDKIYYNHNIQELKEKERNIQELNQELKEIYFSKSWKITKPLRNIFNTIRKLF